MLLTVAPTDCDVQLFAPSGVIENPTMTSALGSHTCRVLINAPPSVKIRIRALSMGPVVNSTAAQSTFIMVREEGDSSVLILQYFNANCLVECTLNNEPSS